MSHHQAGYWHLKAGLKPGSTNRDVISQENLGCFHNERLSRRSEACSRGLKRPLTTPEADDGCGCSSKFPKNPPANWPPLMDPGLGTGQFGAVGEQHPGNGLVVHYTFLYLHRWQGSAKLAASLAEPN